MIALLTDFGQSEYAGVMKGVIYGIDPNARIVDLCHDVSPQSIIEASWILKSAYKYFPRGTIFCCVVDPGVGTSRKALAVKTEDYYFVAPDNGVLWETLRGQGRIEARQIPIPKGASRTFHGRDVFAKAAAVISRGDSCWAGAEVGQIERCELYRRGRRGIIVRIDRFGNIVANLPKPNRNHCSVDIGGETFGMRLCRTYAEAPAGRLFVIVGSGNTVEISVKNGSANDVLQLSVGSKITIY